MSDLNTYLARWADAHLIDAGTAERIRTFAGGWALERGRRRLILQARERALGAK